MNELELVAIINETRNECMKRKADSKGLEGLYCPMRFDGWSCWPDTPAGSTANLSCPYFIDGFVTTRNVYYKCEEDGTWQFVEKYNRSWVNYTTCVNVEDLGFRNKILIIDSVGYSVSLVALLISLAILFYFKSLRCARIQIHMNLFASFAITNFLSLLWNYFVVGNADVTGQNKPWCIVLYIIIHYCFLISNYSWMLCEGLYLHTVLVWAFISQSRLLMWMQCIGWGLPILSTVISVPLRLFLDEGKELTECWMTESKFKIIQQVLVGFAVIMNLFLLINIVRVLVIKLRRGPANDGSGSGASRSSLQALRATMLLVPLLGVNYLLLPFRPDPDHPWEHAYEYVSAITISFQGLCVAILFCFCNGEFVRSTYPTNGEEKV